MQTGIECKLFSSALLVFKKSDDRLNSLLRFLDESLNVFHRWSARLFLLLATIHSIGRIYINAPQVSFYLPPDDPHPRGYIFAGVFGYFLFGILILGAARSIRHRFYS